MCNYVAYNRFYKRRFLTKPPKGTSLADFTRFEPLCVLIHSGGFPLGVTTKKEDTTKSCREVIFHLFAGNFLHSTKFN